MNFYVITEPEYSENYWNTKYMAGLRSAVRENKGKLVEVKFNDLDKINQSTIQDLRLPIIINGRSSDWIASLIPLVCDKGFHPILLASHNYTPQRGVSSLRFDFYGLYTSYFAYFAKRGLHNMALVGANKNNVSDKLKCQALNDYNKGYGKGKADIYYMESSMQDCLKSFIENADNYDAVLCTNDVVAIILKSMLRKSSFKGRLQVHSIWDSPLSKHISHQDKLISLDYNELARQAIKVYNFLVNNPEIESVATTVKVNMSEHLEPVKSSYLKPNENTFLQDPSVKDVYTLEKLFSSLDEIDFHIINGILNGDTYDMIAERESVSLGTIKYRVKKMLELAEKNKREELIKLITKYLQTELI